MSSASHSIRVLPPENPNFFPASVPISGEMYVALRRKVEEEAAKLTTYRNLISAWMADFVENNPEEAMEAARRNIKPFLQRERITYKFLRLWDDILEKDSPAEICELLRDVTPKTEQLRLSAPCFCVIPTDVKRKLYSMAYDS